MCVKKSSSVDRSTANSTISTIGLEKNIFKIYAIDKYAGKTKDFIDNEYEEFELKDLNKLLKKDEGYHMRIQKNDYYIFFWRL
jgi:hypothetical protein